MRGLVPVTVATGLHMKSGGVLWPANSGGRFACKGFDPLCLTETPFSSELLTFWYI